MAEETVADTLNQPNVSTAGEQPGYAQQASPGVLETIRIIITEAYNNNTVERGKEVAANNPVFIQVAQIVDLAIRLNKPVDQLFQSVIKDLNQRAGYEKEKEPTRVEILCGIILLS